MILAGRSFYEIELAYKSRFRKAFAASIGVMAVAVLISWVFFPYTPTAPQEPKQLGREGPPLRLAEISPKDRFEAQVQAVARRRSAAGAVRLIEFEIEESEPREIVRVVERPRAPVREPDTDPDIPVPPPEPVVGPWIEIGELVPLQPPAIAVQVELNEDLSTVSATTPSAITDEFAILEMVRPMYPSVSEYYEVEGLVTIRATVEPSGAVAHVATLENQADAFCERAAQQALLAWQFRPIVVEQKPVWFSVVVPFRFRLE
jgi:periplasmic protein TonB